MLIELNYYDNPGENNEPEGKPEWRARLFVNVCQNSLLSNRSRLSLESKSASKIVLTSNLSWVVTFEARNKVELAIRDFMAIWPMAPISNSQPEPTKSRTMPMLTRTTPPMLLPMDQPPQTILPTTKSQITKTPPPQLQGNLVLGDDPRLRSL